MTDIQLFANNGKSTLAGNINNSQLNITVSAGEGARFPSPTGVQFFLVTLESNSGNEIVKIRSRSGDILTADVSGRGFEGTATSNWTAGDTVEMRITKTTLESFVPVTNAIVTSLSNVATNGLLGISGTTITPRTITGTAGQITITNGDGVSANPTIALTGSIATPGIYVNVTVDQFGRVTSGTGSTIYINNFSGTGAQTAFTLGTSPGSINDVEVFVAGVRKYPSIDYTLSGTTLTFLSAPASGTNNILVRYAGTAPVSSFNYIVDKFIGNGSTTNFTLSSNPGTTKNASIFVDGIFQEPDIDYTISNNLLNFATAPPSDTATNILVKYGVLLPAAPNYDYLVDVFTGNGSTTVYTLSAAPGSSGNADVFVNGVRKTPVVDYTIVNLTLTFAVAPVNTSTILIKYGVAYGITSSWLQGQATYDPPSLGDGAGATTTVSVPGAAMGDFAVASFSNAVTDITVSAWVSGANVVSVRFQNESGILIDLGSGTLRARVLKF